MFPAAAAAAAAVILRVGKKQTRQIYAAKQAGRHTRTIKLMEAN